MAKEQLSPEDVFECLPNGKNVKHLRGAMKYFYESKIKIDYTGKKFYFFSFVQIMMLLCEEVELIIIVC